jgi:hypothetical protein
MRTATIGATVSVARLWWRSGRSSDGRARSTGNSSGGFASFVNGFGRPRTIAHHAEETTAKATLRLCFMRSTRTGKGGGAAAETRKKDGGASS